MTLGFPVDLRCDYLRKQVEPERERVHSWSTTASSHSELPEYDYPTPICVRNTFIDTPVVRPFSLDEFVKERRIQSCPIETCGSSDDGDDAEEAPEKPSSLRRAVTSSATILTDAASDAAFAASRAVSSFRDWWSPVAVDSFALPVDASETPDQGTPQVLCLAGALGEPVLGSSELPTVGSAGHKWGACKPCAFLYKRGCENGVECSFCHLCDSGEKKRRQKEKVARLKEMRGTSCF